MVEDRNPFEQALAFIRSLNEEQLVLRWVNHIYKAYQLQEFELIFENSLRLKYQDKIGEPRVLRSQSLIMDPSSIHRRIQSRESGASISQSSSRSKDDQDRQSTMISPRPQSLR